MKHWKTFKSVVQCAGLYASACLLDIISSMHFPEGIEEGNPFARHSDGSFWPAHALITDGVVTLAVAMASGACYVAGRALGSRWARFLACGPWLYFGWLHLDAAMQNLLIEIPGLYQQTTSEMLRHLLGH